MSCRIPSAYALSQSFSTVSLAQPCLVFDLTGYALRLLVRLAHHGHDQRLLISPIPDFPLLVLGALRSSPAQGQ